MSSNISLECYNNSFGKRVADIDFIEELNENSMLKLQKSIKAAFDYFKCSEVNININSPGGQGNCMYFIADLFSKYKNSGKVIGVTATLKACSAGAFLLTCGTIGKRAAYKNASLLYHYARVPMKNSYVTEEGAKYLTDGLKRENSILLDNITEFAVETLNCFQGIFYEKKFEGFIAEARQMGIIKGKKFQNINPRTEKLKEVISYVYDELLKMDSFITPEQAINLLLIDTIVK